MKILKKNWFSASEAAAYCGYRSPRQIYTAIRDGELPAYNRGRRGGYRIYREDLDAWVRSDIKPPVAATQKNSISKGDVR